MTETVRPGGEVVAVRQRTIAATQRLLGDSISISEDDWHAPTALPGWTRANVAAHLARNADGLRRLAGGLLRGKPATMYDSRPARDRDIARGSGLTALELQIDLDTSAMRLTEAFDLLTDEHWSATVKTAGNTLRADLMPLLRLNEVVLHHVDLDLGFSLDDLDPIAARWLLEWNAFRMGTRFAPTPVVLRADSGFVARLGSEAIEAIEVTGTDANLVGWLTGRLDRSVVSGAEHLSIGARA